MTTPLASELLGVTNAGARCILERLVDARILQSLEGYWPRFYLAAELLDVIEAEDATAT